MMSFYVYKMDQLYTGKQARINTKQHWQKAHTSISLTSVCEN